MSTGIQHIRMCPKGRDYIVASQAPFFKELRSKMGGRLVKWKKIPMLDLEALGKDACPDNQLQYVGGSPTYAIFKDLKTYKEIKVRIPKYKRRRVKVLCVRYMEWGSSRNLWKTEWYRGEYIGEAPLALTTKSELWQFAKDCMSVQGKLLVKKILANFNEGTDFVTWC